MKVNRIIGLTVTLVSLGAIITLAVVRGQGPTTGGTGGMPVTATYYPLYEIAKQVGGDYVQVTNATPAGAEPHEYEPSPQAFARMQQSSVFIYNGATFEPWAGSFLRSYKHVVVKASSGIPLTGSTGTDGADKQHMSDPHFWLDPVYAQTIVESVRAGLTQADPAHAGAYARNAAAYNVALQRLDQEFAAGLKTCQTRTIVTSHAAFGYLAKRYDLQVIPIAGVSPEDEPSAAALARISELVKAEHIKVVFFERLASPRLADTIARETGAQTAVFDPIEGLDDAAQKAGDTYVTIQHSNLGALRNALSCR